jgi:hypothetical protein
MLSWCYAASRRLIETSDEALIIPAPVLVEVDYWISVRLHPGVLVALLDDVRSGAYQVEESRSGEYRRIREIAAARLDGAAPQSRSLPQNWGRAQGRGPSGRASAIRHVLALGSSQRAARKVRAVRSSGRSASASSISFMNSL